MKNLCAQWRAVKNEYMLRPTEVTTFDEMEKYLLDKKHLKDVITDPTLFLEQNAAEKSKKDKKKKDTGKKPAKVEKPPTGAVPLALHRVKTLTFHLFAAAAAKTNSYFLHISTIYTYLLFPMTERYLSYSLDF